MLGFRAGRSWLRRSGKIRGPRDRSANLQMNTRHYCFLFPPLIACSTNGNTHLVRAGDATITLFFVILPNTYSPQVLFYPPEECITTYLASFCYLRMLHCIMKSVYSQLSTYLYNGSYEGSRSETLEGDSWPRSPGQVSFLLTYTQAELL